MKWTIGFGLVVAGCSGAWAYDGTAQQRYNALQGEVWDYQWSQSQRMRSLEQDMSRVRQDMEAAEQAREMEAVTDEMTRRSHERFLEDLRSK